jgi:hypothetical protein
MKRADPTTGPTLDLNPTRKVTSSNGQPRKETSVTNTKYRSARSRRTSYKHHSLRRRRISREHVSR